MNSISLAVALPSLREPPFSKSSPSPFPNFSENKHILSASTWCPPFFLHTSSAPFGASSAEPPT